MNEREFVCGGPEGGEVVCREERNGCIFTVYDDANTTYNDIIYRYMMKGFYIMQEAVKLQERIYEYDYRGTGNEIIPHDERIAIERAIYNLENASDDVYKAWNFKSNPWYKSPWED